MAAPALSLRAYRPEPVDFSMAAPSGALLGNAARQGDGVVSRAAARAQALQPGRAELATDAGREPAMAVRARRDGGELDALDAAGRRARRRRPTRATEAGRGTASSSPTWVGEADWVQYRLERARCPACGCGS